MQSPIGPLHLISDGSYLRGVIFQETWTIEKKQFLPLVEQNCEILEHAEAQLTEYFSGKRKDFNLPIKTDGTVFQESAWAALRKIPYGNVISYSEQAKKIKNEKAVRAVGTANKRNPIAIINPCHRVISKSGGLRGFNGGLSAKEFLLNLEKEN